MSVIEVEEDGPTVAAAGRDPLDVTAAKIRACLLRADNQRITAGQLLIEAHERVTAGEAGNMRWQAWCLANIDRSYRNVQRLITVAKADDPQAALAKDRAAARARMQRLRQAPNSATGAATNAVEAFDANRLVRAALEAYRALDRTQRLEFQQETKLRPLSELRDLERAYRRVNASSEVARARTKTAERKRDELRAASAKVAGPFVPTPAPKRTLTKRAKPMRSRLQRLIATSWGLQFPEMSLRVNAVQGQDAGVV